MWSNEYGPGLAEALIAEGGGPRAAGRRPHDGLIGSEEGYGSKSRETSGRAKGVVGQVGQAHGVFELISTAWTGLGRSAWLQPVTGRGALAGGWFHGGPAPGR